MKKIFPYLRCFLLLWIFLPGSAHAQSWTVAWSDEFNGAVNSAIDQSKWQYDTGILKVNNELEYYCAPGSSTSPCVSNQPNAYIDGDGHLVIKAIKITSSVEPYSSSWTSARLNSANNLANFKYGRIESSMKLPIGAGIWPAFWGLATNIDTTGWPSSGEIDIMENIPATSGLGPGVVRSTLHGQGYSGSDGLGQNYALPNGGQVNTGFHTYGAIWSANMLQFYLDDSSKAFLVRTASDIPAGTKWPFNADFFLLLNLAVGGTGSWPGPADSTTPNPASMLVDYVRAYKPSRVTPPSLTATPIEVTAGQVGTSTLILKSSAGSGRLYLACTTTATKAACSVASTDPLNSHTVDFSNSDTGSAKLTLTTTNGGTIAGNYAITVNAYTVSSTTDAPDAATNIPVKIN